MERTVVRGPRGAVPNSSCCQPIGKVLGTCTSGLRNGQAEKDSLAAVQRSRRPMAHCFSAPRFLNNSVFQPGPSGTAMTLEVFGELPPVIHVRSGCAKGATVFSRFS